MSFDERSGVIANGSGRDPQVGAFDPAPRSLNICRIGRENVTDRYLPAARYLGDRDDPQGLVVKLHYVHDPMCSWCWAFGPAWREIRARLPSRVAAERVLCGLAPDTREPMPEAMRQYIQGTWRRIEREVPGTRFNYGFWTRCRPRRSTYPACRAVIAAISRGPELEEPMIEAIQRAYYLEARNPSDDETLIALAEAMGLERERFTLDLNSAATQAELGRQIRFAARLGARGAPSLILTAGGKARPIAYHYRDPAVVLEQLGL